LPAKEVLSSSHGDLKYRKEKLDLKLSLKDQLFNQKLKAPLTFLDSAHKNFKGSRWSVLAENPRHSLISKDTAILNDGSETSGDVIDILAKLHRFRSFKKLPPEYPWPGAVVALSYDLKDLIEPSLKRGRQKESTFPDVVAYFFDIWVCYDHVDNQYWLLAVDHDNDSNFDQRYDDFKTRLLNPEQKEQQETKLIPESVLPSEASYLESVEFLLEGIKQGDYYQANMSRKYKMTLEGSPRDLYRQLHERSPNPYNVMMEFGSQAIFSASPEQFIEINEKGRVRSRPIKGTRPRSKVESEDQLQYQQLIDSTKDQAELAMIVDLIRNDLGRFCQFGSVKVPERRYVEQHTSVHHTVANVEGLLDWPWDLAKVIRAMVPGGSITGCPKIAAMQVLLELEPESRGFYSGNILFLDALGKMDSNILIRTLLLDHKKVSLQVGGGIVSDSLPEMELKETKDKAASLLDACGLKDVDFTE
jgi:anthranilate/para-aminobenzoate synthase component I